MNEIPLAPQTARLLKHSLIQCAASVSYSGKIDSVYIAAYFSQFTLGAMTSFLSWVKGHCRDNSGCDLIYWPGKLMGGLQSLPDLELSWSRLSCLDCWLQF